ncbi:MAG: hypothetical protein SF339_13315 [Blastocatellia bacterium]|nr:hypothetical protein [Blastocatellia bacterium]
MMTSEPSNEERASSAPGWMRLAGVVSLLAVLAVYLLRLDRVVGLFTDDAWYVLLAKGLASGQGYSIVNSPTPGILPLYPPAFPFLLSLVFRLSPNFPDNVWLLKSVSMLAMLGTGLLAYRYFVRDRELPAPWALAIAVGAVLSPPLVFLATSTVMSECVFAFLFLATIVVMERCVRAGSGARGLQLAVAGAALASAGFLTRSIAFSLVVAGGLYLLKARLVKSAIVFGIAVAIFVGPWMLYSRSHAPTPAQQREQGGHIVLPYSTQFWQRRAGFSYLGTVTAADLPGRVAGNLNEIAGRDIGRIVATPVFEALRDPFAESKKQNVQEGARGETLWFSFALSLLAIVGLATAVRRKITMAELAVPLSLGIIALWPWETFRFVLPLIPFVIFYLMMGVQGLGELHASLRKQAPGRFVRGLAFAVLLFIVGVNLYGNVNYILKYAGGDSLDRPQWLQVFDNAEDLLKWTAANLPPDTVIATNNAPLVNLYTGRKTISADEPAANWSEWERMKIRYMVLIPIYFDPAASAESRYRPVYRVQNNAMFRVLDLGEPGARAPWQ